MAVSKKLRFEVFKRDLFTCQYCGKRPPEAVLEVDHVHPRSGGGCDTIDNLKCACFECNRGKAATPLHPDEPPMETADPALMDACQYLWNYWWQTIPNLDAVDAFQDSTARHFFKKGLYLVEMEEAVEETASRVNQTGMSAQDAWRYFCAICWVRIRQKGVHGE